MLALEQLEMLFIVITEQAILSLVSQAQAQRVGNVHSCNVRASNARVTKSQCSPFKHKILYCIATQAKASQGTTATR